MPLMYCTGESAGLRVPLAGLNSSGQYNHIVHGALYRAGSVRREGRSRLAPELNPQLDMHTGQDAANRLSDLAYSSDYDDEGYVISSAEVFYKPSKQGNQM